MHSPGLAEMVCKTGAHVRLQSSLTMEEREFAILSVCREKDAAYEWVSHVGTARKAGMRDEAVEVLRNNGDTSTLKDDERDMINYTRELLRQNRVSQPTFDSLLKRHGERWLVSTPRRLVSTSTSPRSTPLSRWSPDRATTSCRCPRRTRSSSAFLTRKEGPRVNTRGPFIKG